MSDERCGRQMTVAGHNTYCMRPIDHADKFYGLWPAERSETT